MGKKAKKVKPLAAMVTSMQRKKVVSKVCKKTKKGKHKYNEEYLNFAARHRTKKKPEMLQIQPATFVFKQTAIDKNDGLKQKNSLEEYMAPLEPKRKVSKQQKIRNVGFSVLQDDSEDEMIMQPASFIFKQNPVLL